MIEKIAQMRGVRRVFSVVGWETPGLHQAAYLVAGFAFLSQLLALLRDRLLAGTFGAGPTLDLYYAAFRIPDLLFATVASLLSLYALLPILSRLEAVNPGRMLSFMRRTLLLFFLAMGVVSGVLYLVAPGLIPALVPGIAGDPTAYDHLLLLTRILLLQPILLGASNILANLTQLRHRFVLYSISPLLYNIGIIFGIVVLYPAIGIAGLGWGVVLGALLHVLVQVPFFTAERAGEPLPFSEMFRALRDVLMLSLPRTLALASTQITLLVLIALASLLSAGSIAIFSFAYNLQAVPIAIIGVSYSVAAFPTLARLHAEGKTHDFVNHIETALRHLLFWSIPATVFIIVLRAELVRTILGAGLFNWNATRLTAAALALFILSLAAQNVTLLIARTYYAAGNSRKPLYFGMADIAVSVLSAFALVALFHESAFLRAFIEEILRVADIPGTTVLMLALGYALGSIAECSIGLYFFIHDFALPTERLRRLVFQSFAASVIGAAAAYGVLAALGVIVNINKTLEVFAAGFGAGVVGLFFTALILVVLKNEEYAEVRSVLRRRFAYRPAVALEPTDISS